MCCCDHNREFSAAAFFTVGMTSVQTMNAYKLLATAVLTACATPGLVFATCSHSTDITKRLERHNADR